MRLHIRLNLSFILFFYLLIAQPLSAQIITTIAGDGLSGYTGDGGPASAAKVGTLMSVAVDGYNNIYIGDGDNDVIRKIDLNGIITTIAGTGLSGYTGDGGPALLARLDNPRSFTIDKDNNLYFRHGSSYIRKITAAGIISTVAGSPGVSDCFGDGGLAINARFRSLTGVSVDKSGNLLVSDFGCQRVRKISTAGIISAFAGTGVAGFSGDGGQATSARLQLPGKVDVDNAGNVYIPDGTNHRIRVVSPAGVISTFAGDGIMGQNGDGGNRLNAQFIVPNCIAIDRLGNIFIQDYHTVRKIDPSGVINIYAGNYIQGYTGDGGPANQASLNASTDIALDNAGNLYIASYGALRKVSLCQFASISQHPAPVVLCNSGVAKFSVRASFAAGYKWQVDDGNGWSDLVDNSVYNGSASPDLTVNNPTTAINGFQYRCTVVNSCGDVQSTPAKLSILPPSPAAVSITASSAQVCEGSPVVFTATPFNEGGGPNYQWKKNNNNVGTNAASYSDANLTPTDLITCVLTSNSTCTSSPVAVSNAILTEVKPVINPAVSISASANNVCYGTAITFSASGNGGMSSRYTWAKNGVPVGINSATYIDKVLNNSDVITCDFAPGTGCFTTSSVTSNSVVLTINPLVTPAITIQTIRPTVCKGDPVILKANVLHEGSSPIFSWRVNGEVRGSNAKTFTSNLSNGDQVICMLTSDASCLTKPSVSSNNIVVTVAENPVVRLDQNTNICMGSVRTLDAGKYTAYQWSTGHATQTIQVNDLGKFWVDVTDKNGCKGADTVDIKTVLPLPTDFLQPDTALCSYGTLSLKPNWEFKNYRWNSGSRSKEIVINKPGTYWLEATDANNCVGKDTIVVKQKQCVEGLFVPNSFSPNGDGKNDILRPLIFGKLNTFHLVIFNRWGQKIFESYDVSKGWDGKLQGKESATSTFMWTCEYQFDGRDRKLDKGSIFLLR